ncbi:MAG: SpoIVB peptidase S55 domain-containing protein [Hespellia sp.]|nr:SpoIVB peptidase S55 domain-containing protein [Hespellia sp.]
MNKKLYRKCLLLFTLGVLLFATFGYYISNDSFSSENPSANASEVQSDMVLLGGMPIGIYMQTDGVLILGAGDVERGDGTVSRPAEHLVKAGDYITAINQTPVQTKKELIKELKKTAVSETILSIRRNDENIEVKMHPIKNTEGDTMLGIWVRDDVQGLGTITYIKDHTFAALGHGIHDTDTNQLLEIEQGILYRTNIRSISKGTNGSPGSMEGIIVYNRLNELGTIYKNSATGIYGTIDNLEEVLKEKIPIQTAGTDEIQTGAATIRCEIGDSIQEYQIEITHLDYSNHEINKGMTIEITDPALLDQTGGIVQGMSGSPIIQNGKLVGAVTHVFVKDSKKGYGIFIENMSKEETVQNLSN